MEYLHRIFGIYTTRQEAEEVRDRLEARGFKRKQLELLDRPGPTGGTELGPSHPSPDEVRNDTLMGGAVGAAAGTAAGALGEAALAAANVSLFIASPVIGTLSMIGWGAMAGGVLGAAIGAGGDDKRSFSDLVQDALKSGHAVLIVYAADEQQTVLARKVIGASVQDPGQQAVE